MKKEIFITGIGTDVGKTLASAILCRTMNAAYWKPIQSGTTIGSDKHTIRELAGEDIQIFKEIYALEEPLSPHTAARLENVDIDIQKLTIPEHSGTLIIEGAGGLMVPITRDFLYAEWLKTQQIPTILVSRHYLGSINHTLLSLELMKNLGLKLLGVLFIGHDNDNNEALICERYAVRNLGNIPETKILNSDFVELTAKSLVEYWKLNHYHFLLEA
jgi:dethiobiotin synthetase